ncbi:SUR7/PalI family-domain-containing protein [Xylariaceae sp. AK1471]|nr:SUR7/PalI family-domain-containing protein [Xylariaceae sp. AK1471]
MAVRKSAGLNWAIAIILSLISLLFTLITLLSGLGGHSLASYLTIDTTNIAIPAKLSSSTFLQDLSKISGSDLVGQSGSRQSLGLSSTYSISLLTACGRNDDGSTACYTPRVGFTFNPGSDLKLDRTAAQGTLSAAFYSQLHTYSAVSTFVSVAYILASLLTILSCLSVVLSRRYERALLVSRISSAIVAILIFAATVASIVTFVRLRDAFNAALSDIGIKTATSSSAFALSVVATVASIAAFVLVLFIRPTTSSYRGQYHREKQDVGGESSHGEAEPMSRQEPRAASMGVGFLERVPTWNRPRYAQIRGKKLSIVHSRDPSPGSDREGLIDPVQDDVAHGGFAREDRYSQSRWEKKHSKQNLDHMQTAYEPNAI